MDSNAASRLELQDLWRKLSRDEINGLPLRRYPGPMHVVSDEEDLLRALSVLETETLLGFDTETRPAFRKGVSYPPSLIQLAGSKAVYVLQLRQLHLPERLRQLLSTPGIIKAGVSVKDDIGALQQVAPFEPGGFVDLGDVARDLGLQTNGLRNMAANFLRFRISKKAQRSNWARQDLTSSQLLYAATDAWVSRLLFLRMQILGLLEQAGVALSFDRMDRRETVSRHQCPRGTGTMIGGDGQNGR